DIDKINYNRKMIGENFNIDVKIGVLMSQSKGSTFVFELGNFITVLELRADELEGKMAFYDCIMDMPRAVLNNILTYASSQNIATEWFKVQEKLLENFSQENDIVRLLKPDF